jgi:Tripartite tricarboxylate transporter family receptor
VVENRPSAGGHVGIEAVARAQADGYTLLLALAGNTMNATLFERLNYDFIRDIAPIASINHIPLVLASNPSFPPKTVPELIAYAKANPSKVNMATAGVGTMPQVAGELFKILTGAEIASVRYRGSAPVMTDLLGGHVQVAFDAVSSSIEHIKSGRLRDEAVATPKETGGRTAPAHKVKAPATQTVATHKRSSVAARKPAGKKHQPGKAKAKAGAKPSRGAAGDPTSDKADPGSKQSHLIATNAGSATSERGL